MELRLTALLPALVALTTACSHGGEEPAAPDAGAAMAFAPTLTGQAAMSRATDLSESATDFAVTAWKGDGAELQYVLRHDDGTPYQARLIGADWLYDIVSLEGTQQYLRYWDLSASSYTFSAYAPYSVYDTSTGSYVPASTLHTITMAADGRVSVTGVKANVAATPATRWLTALHRRTASPLADTDLLSASTAFPALTAMTQSVPLMFHHLLGEIELRAYSADGSPLNISHARIELVDAQNSSTPSYFNTLADYNGSAWTNASEPESVIFESGSLGVTGTASAPTTLATLVELPQAVDNRWMKAVFTIGTDTLTGYFQLPAWNDAAETTPYGWWPDKKHIYTFMLSLTQEIILMHIDVGSFLWQDGNYVDADTQTNW